MSNNNDGHEVFVDLGDGIDYYPHFIVDKVFPGFDEAFNWATDVAMSYNFGLVKGSGKTDLITGASRRYIDCERGGKSKSKYVNNPEFAIRKNTDTKKRRCPFRLRVQQHNNGNYWSIRAVKPLNGQHRGFHNHRSIVHMDGHRRYSGLTDPQKSFVKQQMEGEVRPGQVKTTFEAAYPNQPQPTSRQISNLMNQYRVEERQGNTHAEQMLYMAQKKNYIFNRVVDEETNKLNRVFMANEEAVKLVRTYHYIVLIDSTYKTNLYKMPFVELIGITPVGCNFTIGYAMVENEKTESYIWILSCLKAAMDLVEPSVIVTDCEKGLLEAIEQVLPNAKHFLCVWHIMENVESKATKYFGNKEVGRAFAHGRWGAVISAPTVEKFLLAWNDLKNSYYYAPRLHHYLENTWLIHDEKFLCCHTNNILHFGNTATSRVESAHATLKQWLKSLTISLSTISRRVDKMMKVQQSNCRKLLQDSLSRRCHGHYGALFSLLKERVSKYAILKLTEEYKRIPALGLRVLEDCGHMMCSINGMPCDCELHEVSGRHEMVDPETIHEFWKTLDYNDQTQSTQYHLQLLDALWLEVQQVDPSLRPVIYAVLQSILRPEDAFLEDPAIIENARGLHRNSTTRNLTANEHTSRRYSSSYSSRPTPSATTTSTSSTTTGIFGGGCAPLDAGWIIGSATSENFIYLRLLFNGIRDYFTGWFNPLSDGQCGFRCISHAVRGNQDAFVAMRNDLYHEITSNPLYGKDAPRGDNTWYPYQNFPQALHRISFFHHTRCEQAHWMENEDLFAFATIHNWAIVVIARHMVGAPSTRQIPSWLGCVTYLPLRANPGIRSPFGILVLLFTGDHWVRLRLQGEFPMPFIAYGWRERSDDTVMGWDTIYAERMTRWMSFLPPSDLDLNNPINVD